ncbi:organic hydroperoxide resistance protein [soil metagenome]
MPVLPIDPAYTADVTASGGRKGRAVSSDGVLDLQLKSPGASGDPKATNPEQLFAAGYAACFQNSLMTVARRASEDVSESTVRAEVSLGKVDSDLFGLAVRLTVHIPGVDLARAQELADAAHVRCPYSQATRGNIEVKVVAAE